VKLISLMAVSGVCAASTLAQNLVINGDFDNNGVGANNNQYNLPNANFTALMANATAFGGGFAPGGPGEIDIESNGAPVYGGNSGNGTHHISMAQFDALSLDLSAPVIAGQTYTLSFLARAVTQFTSGLGPLNFGVSNSATAFGSQEYQSGLFTTTWTAYSVNFTASSSGSYLTIEGSRGFGDDNSWIHLDGVSLVAVPSAPSAALLGLGGLAALRRRR
jgi:MYXO-CTERM domain-containing protein